MLLPDMVIIFKKITSVPYENSLSEASLDWSCLGKYLKEDNKILHTPKNKYVRDFIRRTIHGGRVISCTQRFISKSFNEVVTNLEKYYGYNLEVSELFAKFFKHINAIKNNIKKIRI